MQAGLRFDFAQPRLLAFFNRWGLARVQGDFPRPLLGLFTSTALSPHDFSAAVEALAFQSDDVPLVPNVLSPDKCVSGGFSKCQASSYRNYALTWKSGASAPRKWSKDQGAL